MSCPSGRGTDYWVDKCPVCPVCPAIQPYQFERQTYDEIDPLSVRNLLAEKRNHEPGRLARYIHRPEDRGPRNGLTWSEARDLVADGVLTNDWIGVGAAIAILDDEQSTICEFCSEVYRAWDRFPAKIIPDIVNAA